MLGPTFWLYVSDVIGQLVGVSYLEIVTLNGRDTEKITLELRDQQYAFHQYFKCYVVEHSCKFIM